MRIHIRRVRLLWRPFEWEVYSSAYGLAFGRSWTRRSARKRALEAERWYMTSELS